MNGPLHIDVALCDVSATAGAHGVTDTLSAAQRQRWQTIRSANGRRQYLTSRWLLRALLGHRVGMPASEVALADTPGAAPRLRDSGLRLGLSHSNEFCLCVCAAATVGCDVEHQRPRRRSRQIAREFFAAREAAYLERLSSAAVPASFYRLWTLKEAGHKALGQGLAHGLARPAFTLLPALRCQIGPDRGAWWFAASDLTAHDQRYSLALAVRAGHATIRAHRYWPGPGGGPEREDFDPDWSITAVDLDDRSNAR